MKARVVVSIISCAALVTMALLLTTTSAQAAGTVVGIGSASSCNEAALTAAVAAGGPISFNCGSSKATITLTKELVIGVNVSLDSAGLVTISGGGSVRVMHVKPGINLDLSKI